MPRITMRSPLAGVGEAIAATNEQRDRRAAQEADNARSDRLLSMREQSTAFDQGMAERGMALDEAEGARRAQAFEADLKQAQASLEGELQQQEFERQDRARRIQSEDAGAQFAQTIGSMSPEQQAIFGRMTDPRHQETFLQLAMQDQQLQRFEKLRQGMETYALSVENDPEYPLPQGSATRIAAMYADDPEKGYQEIETLAETHRHQLSQMQRRSYARQELMNIREQFSDYFKPVVAGMESPTQERIKDLIREINEPPSEYGDPERDYAGALAELRLLVQPELSIGLRRVEERYKQDFATMFRSSMIYGPGGMGPPMRSNIAPAIPDRNSALNMGDGEPPAADGAGNGEDTSQYIGGTNPDAQKAWADSKLSDDEKRADKIALEMKSKGLDPTDPEAVRAYVQQIRTTEKAREDNVFGRNRHGQGYR